MDDTEIVSRDPKIFGRNVRAFRVLRRWSIRDLSVRSGLSTKTIVKIERGESCTARTEQKIADGFGSLVGRLWDATLITDEPERLIRKDEGRWFFGDVDDAKRYHQRLGMSQPDLTDARFRCDPDEIQNEAERIRLGHAGLSTAFVKPMGGGMAAGYFKYSKCEVYAPDFTPSDGFNYAYIALCERGSVRMRISEREHVLHEGDALVYQGENAYWIEPAFPIGPTTAPPSVMFICLGVLALPKP